MNRDTCDNLDLITYQHFWRHLNYWSGDRQHHDSRFYYDLAIASIWSHQLSRSQLFWHFNYPMIIPQIFHHSYEAFFVLKTDQTLCVITLKTYFNSSWSTQNHVFMNHGQHFHLPTHSITFLLLLSRINLSLSLSWQQLLELRVDLPIFKTKIYTPLVWFSISF